MAYSDTLNGRIYQPEAEVLIAAQSYVEMVRAYGPGGDAEDYPEYAKIDIDGEYVKLQKAVDSFREWAGI